MVDNPLTILHADISAPDEVNIITNEDTLEIAVVFNRCYELMLTMLLYLYGGAWRHPKRSFSFTNAIFFPLMTMFIRPLAEILTQLPAFRDRPGNAGPGFELPHEIVVLPAYRALWHAIQERFDALAEDLGRLRILQRKEDYPEIAERLRYMRENMRRLAEDWRTDWKDVGDIGSE
ncbi:MAG TPA: hypothetical protein VHU83_11960 [Bryobacteraceae bacterium]|nr:hypothetical protein [Bryobacteraceae bacterium]